MNDGPRPQLDCMPSLLYKQCRLEEWNRPAADMGETIHKIFDRMVPEPLKHRLQVIRDTSELRRVPAPQCHADVLLPVQNIDLAEIWGSPEIESKWNTA